ncbi:MAG TPA: type IV toxin-antitoxin system AbiEi family antitoxin domain-containing protein [Mycobacteriales bacterium]|nr:type IV toxin-antitoxin system AbiEi family antitoxin domain-containing protein [Mycobacteriales bacterium]
MPPAAIGESSYQRDYRVASALKGLADDHPGTALLVNHHDRKASAEDFVDAVSGTHGLAGAADTILVVARDRAQPGGLLKVTGRDIVENAYAVEFTYPDWRLDGADLTAAAEKAEQVVVTAGLGDRSAEVIAFVMRQPKLVSPKAIVAELGIPKQQVGVYLSRAVEAGRLRKVARGLYSSPVRTVRSVSLGERESTEANAPNLTVLTPAVGAPARAVRDRKPREDHRD